MGFSTAEYPTSHVWKTANAGASWTDWTGMGLPDAPVNALLVDSLGGQVYAGTDVGVFASLRRRGRLVGRRLVRRRERVCRDFCRTLR
jgi:hypothetical protein